MSAAAGLPSCAREGGYIEQPPPPTHSIYKVSLLLGQLCYTQAMPPGCRHSELRVVLPSHSPFPLHPSRFWQLLLSKNLQQVSQPGGVADEHAAQDHARGIHLWAERPLLEAAAVSQALSRPEGVQRQPCFWLHVDGEGTCPLPHTHRAEAVAATDFSPNWWRNSPQSCISPQPWLPAPLLQGHLTT